MTPTLRACLTLAVIALCIQFVPASARDHLFSEMMASEIVASSAQSDTCSSIANYTDTSNATVGYCLPIGNNIPQSVGTVRMDTYYGSVNCCGPEKRSQDPVPPCSSGEICDDIGYSMGSWYWIAAWLTAPNGTELCTKKTLYFDFNVHRPRETINYDASANNCYWTCSDGAC